MATHETAALREAEELSRAYRDAERDRSYRGGLIIFLISESMFFVTLVATRFLLAGTGHPASLDQVLAGVLTAVMLASLLPAIAIGRAAASGDWPGVARRARITAVAGVALLAGVGWEWHGLVLDPGSRYGGVYYLTVGMHALHVLIGAALLLGVAGRAQADRFTAHDHFAVEAGQVFWYLVTGLWIAVWAVFYLG